MIKDARLGVERTGARRGAQIRPGARGARRGDPQRNLNAGVARQCWAGMARAGSSAEQQIRVPVSRASGGFDPQPV